MSNPMSNLPPEVTGRIGGLTKAKNVNAKLKRAEEILAERPELEAELIRLRMQKMALIGVNRHGIGTPDRHPKGTPFGEERDPARRSGAGGGDGPGPAPVRR